MIVSLLYSLNGPMRSKHSEIPSVENLETTFPVPVALHFGSFGIAAEIRLKASIGETDCSIITIRAESRVILEYVLLYSRQLTQKSIYYKEAYLLVCSHST
jgi:hypothetical protein